VHGDYLSTLHGLRQGTYRLLIGAGAEGIINFPSLHGALAMLFALVLWPVRALRWIGLTLNVAMIFSVPVEGSHYFVDVFAGIAIACASLLVARAIVKRAHAAAPAMIEPGLVPNR
jgi:membrane-associated phospholipid phosphatase